MRHLKELKKLYSKQKELKLDLMNSTNLTADECNARLAKHNKEINDFFSVHNLEMNEEIRKVYSSVYPDKNDFIH